jgi:acetyl esterase/lipase
MKTQPTKLYLYPAPKDNNTGVAVVVCPGGSYAHTMGIATEGFAVAEWLNSQGISAFVLKYRVGSQGYHHPAMLQDAQMAIHYVRLNAQEYGIDPDKVGTMGFSAGGHLVIMTGAFSKENHLAELGICDNISLRPDFVVPVYPVVSMKDDIAHERSRRNLLTRRYTPGQQTLFSMELSIPPYMPPTFVVTAKDDPVVNYENSVRLDRSLTKAKISHKFLLYETGGHGYGMDETLAPEVGQWKYTFVKWLKEIKIL